MRLLLLLFLLVSKVVVSAAATLAEEQPEATGSIDVSSSLKTWHPEVPDSSREAVSRELRRSLERYEKAESTDEALELLRRHLECDQKVIIVIEGRVFMSVRV